MDILLQIVLTGFVTGGVYGLIALGYVLIFKATGVLNLATGVIMTLGAFICLTFLTKIGAPLWLAFFLTLLAALLLGLTIERVVLRQLIGEPTISVIMVTVGLSSILHGLTHIIWSPEHRSFPQLFPPEALDLGFAVVPSGLWWGFVFAAAATGLFLAVFKFSRTGIAMRATASDQQAAQSTEISRSRC